MPYKDREKQNAYQNSRNQRLRLKWLAEHGPCAKCKSWDRLEVDHVDQTTKLDHKVWTWSEPRRIAELAKCQALCYVCHKEKSASEQRRPITHGKRTGYVRGCRCDECTKAQVGYVYAWRARTGRH